MSPAAACPCGRLAQGRPLAFDACCGPFLSGAALPPDAESLMRSRYSAFVREDRDHLLATWHPEHRPATLDFEPGARWLGLEVRDTRQTDATHAEVEFVARCRVGGRGQRLHERSRFQRVDGRWLYLHGDTR